jgi:hypothetical protein
MVKIRYSELPAGLHVAAAGDRDCTVVYLQPGLTPAQRRAALFRVRSSARIGQGPTLPRPAMARAIAADRVRTSAHVGAAATRRHPMLFLPPLILMVSALVFLFMSVGPLTMTTQGRVAAQAVPKLGIGTPSHAPNRTPAPHHHAGRAVGPTQSTHVQPAPSRPSCTTRPSLWEKWPWLAPPSAPEPRASFTSRCMRLGPFERWLRTHRF